MALLMLRERPVHVPPGAGWMVAVLLVLGWAGCQRGPDAVPRESPVRPAQRAAAAPAPPPPECPIHFVDVTDESGITFVHTDGSSGRHYIAETVTSGLATFDYDGDGLVDIYFPNGAPLPGTQTERPPRHALYRNLGNMRFRDVTEAAGVACAGYGLGATVGDFDNDGDLDLYVSNFGPKVLYRNNGDGTFTDVTRAAGVADGEKLGAGAAFLDADRDGDLDLFVANYVKFTYETPVVLYNHGPAEYVGPRAYPPDLHAFFLNNGDGTFTDASVTSGIAKYPGKGMGMVCADYDRDGDTDIFVLNDVFENFCFQNDGAGKFREVALLNGFKYNGEGMPLGSMGVDCADYDNNGWLDFFQTSYSEQLPALYRNTGRGYFEEVTAQAVPGSSLVPYINWGVSFADFDNDGLVDLFVANGNTQDNLKDYSAIASYEAPNALLRGIGGGKFADVSDACGDGLAPRYSSRGSAADDLDNDGRVDIVVLNARNRPTVIRNDSPRAANHWFQIELRGNRSNRDGVGAHVYVTAGGKTQLQEVHSGRSYQGHCGSRLHFGLGPAERVDAIEVRWIGGHVDRLKDFKVDRRVLILEGGVAEYLPAGD
ncbi:MAG: CRTAC1 family protein [Thermoguttaceae bacterium]|nr:CRTAC1 family protein [Thermoguttaceae bacterium]